MKVEKAQKRHELTLVTVLALRESRGRERAVAWLQLLLLDHTFYSMSSCDPDVPRIRACP